MDQVECMNSELERFMTRNLCAGRFLLSLFHSAWLLISAISLSAAPGDEHWDVQFGWPGTTNSVYALAVEGAKVYACGLYSTPAVTETNFVEVWDGARWNYIPGLEGTTVIFDFAFLGGEMYVAGVFSRAGTNRAPGLARWNGSRWSDVGGFAGAVLTAVSDGSKLYVGGAFTNAGNVIATNVACWDGSQWSAMSGGLGASASLGAEVDVLHFHQGVLYAGGDFTNSGPASVRRLARWDGNNWLEVDGGADATVYSLASQDTSLLVGGSFTVAGSTPANRIARWDGSNWSALGSGMNNTVSALGVVGNLVYAGGSFTNAGGVRALRFAVWNGSSWAATGANGMNDAVNRIKVSGTNVYVGGLFTQADDIVVNHVGVWNGTDWSGLGQAGRVNGVGGIVTAVRAIASSGNHVYVGGLFTGVGKIRANRIARFDGTNWYPLGTGIRGTNNSFTTGTAVNAIAADGNLVYAGGIFTNAGGVSANSIACWNGTSWSALGNGIPGSVSAIAVRGSDVFVGGTFTLSTPSGTAFNIARWDGGTWWSLPGLFAGTIGNFFVNAIAVQGNNIVAGGSFTAANFSLNSQSTNIALHNGVEWLPMAGGVNSNVNAIVVIGSDVYVGGRFSMAGGVAASRIALWNGSSWSPLWLGIQGTGNFSVSGLAEIAGNIYASGNFTNAGGVIVSRVAKWDGVNWSALGSGLTRSFSTVTVNALGTRGNDLFAGGSIEYAGGKPSFLFARWNDQIDFDVVPSIQLSKLLGTSTGVFKMTITASGVPSYVVEATTDFSNWTPLQTNSASRYEYLEFPGSGLPYRFYRVRQQ
jgi:hypothetical protein